MEYKGDLFLLLLSLYSETKDDDSQLVDILDLPGIHKYRSVESYLPLLLLLQSDGLVEMQRDISMDKARITAAGIRYIRQSLEKPTDWQSELIRNDRIASDALGAYLKTIEDFDVAEHIAAADAELKSVKDERYLRRISDEEAAIKADSIEAGLMRRHRSSVEKAWRKVIGEIDFTSAESSWPVVIRVAETEFTERLELSFEIDGIGELNRWQILVKERIDMEVLRLRLTLEQMIEEAGRGTQEPEINHDATQEARAPDAESEAVPQVTDNLAPLPRDDFNRSSPIVFLVHGHAIDLRESVARFMEKMHIEVVILDEKAFSGKTLIEKLETYATRSTYAVVLMTGDDLCGERRRARQNVVLELGFFLGSLGRGRLCVIYEAGVELPSDLPIGYIKKESWKEGLYSELRSAGFDIQWP